MSRTIFLLSGVFSAPSLLLMDSAIKGTALLLLAAIAVMILRRDSAATRHLVWLLAMVAMLAVPVLSAMLPQWRVLPKWASISPAPAVEAASPASLASPAEGHLAGTQYTEAGAMESPVALPESPVASSFEVPDQVAAALPDARPAPVTAENPASAGRDASAAGSRNWHSALPLVWAIGSCLLLLRLIAARWMLWKTERQGTPTADNTIVTALQAASVQLGIRRPVTLLLHPDKTIPVVWGLFRCRLLLPAAARHWSGEQLRSVLLHELAHIQRRDTMAQLLSQIACTLHWFNPLVWFAAWRLGVERERACDDLVLASGVRPSDYAGHLLEIVTGLSSARFSQSCGLAMARKSSLEGRLVAVLSENLNRRGVSVALAAIAVAVAAGIAVPLAMLRAADEQRGAADEQRSAADERTGAPMQTSPKPNEGAKLKPGTEEKLQWGEPVNGLRMALAWPPTLAEPASGEVPDFFLAVQNVSEAPVRLCTTAEAPNQRGLTFATRGVIKGMIVSSEPNGGDAALQPREVVFLRLFTESAKNPERAPHGSMIASAVRQSPAMTLRADLEIAKAPAGAWQGKLVTPETRAGVGAEAPKNRKAQELFKVWLGHARVNGKIPGGCIARLGVRVQEFVRGNLADQAGEPYAKRMEPLVARLDGARDWQPAEASALLTDIAAVSDSPLSVMLEETAGGTIQYGPPLKKDLENAPWGEALSNGLRVACLLEPRAAAHRLGTALKMRILVHNAGKEPVVFRSRTWHHIEPTAHNAKGDPIEMESVTRYTLPPLVVYRLVPGGSVELASPGIGIGRYGFHDFKAADIASWISAKDGDEVSLTPGPVPLGDWNEASVLNGQPRWWLDFLTARLNLATPLPADAAERAELLQRTVRYVFHTDATTEEIAAFVADREPNALDSLAKRLAQRAGLTPFTGSLTSGTTKFRVLPADPRGTQPAGNPAATPAPPPAPAPAEKPQEPKSKQAQSLFKMWQKNARTNGNIPGGLVGRLGDKVQAFIRNNTGDPSGDPYAKKMTPLVQHFDAARDWTPAEAVTLLDAIAAANSIPLETTLEEAAGRTLRAGTPLPPEFAGAPWGNAQPNGLRLAWLLEPRAAEHRLGTPLKSSILIHNTGKQAVVLRTRSWHQSGGHKAHDAKGADININSTYWTTLAALVPFRLAPGEFVELTAAGIGVGANKNDEDWQGTRVGSWIEAQEGDEVTFTPDAVPASDWNEAPPQRGEPGWWLDFIAARLACELPLPAAEDERRRLLDRVMHELFGSAPTAEETAAFLADREANALDSLAKRLAHRAGITPFSGPIASGPTRFRVLPVDPDAAKKPRTAGNPGRYTLGENIRLVVTRRPDGERILNEASIWFYSPDPTKPAPGQPHEVQLPDGYNTWAAAWLRGTTVLWVAQKGHVRSYDFTNPAQVKEAALEPANFEKVPKPILDVLRAALDLPGTSSGD